MDYTQCNDDTYGGVVGGCVLTCATGYEGSPNATCNASGSWVYAGDCTPRMFLYPMRNGGSPVSVLALEGLALPLLGYRWLYVWLQ